MKKRRFWVFQTSPINLKALSTQKQGKHNSQVLKVILMHNLKSFSWKFNNFVANSICVSYYSKKNLRLYKLEITNLVCKQGKQRFQK